MVGAVRGVDPRTGYNYDDTKRNVDQVQLKAEDKARGSTRATARRAFSRLDRVLKERDLLS
jgi:4-oxalmesaconate hydratase